MLTIKRLSLSNANILIAGAKAKAEQISIPMCIAITDESGVLIAFERMNGGKTSSVVIAQDKAFTAAAARKATHDYNTVNTPGSLAFGIHTEHGGRISSVAGGVPVFDGDDVVGGIGVSSGTPQQDLDCALAAIAHFEQSSARQKVARV